jgi:hypothetical protein
VGRPPRRTEPRHYRRRNPNNELSKPPVGVPEGTVNVGPIDVIDLGPGGDRVLSRSEGTLVPCTVGGRRLKLINGLAPCCAAAPST